MKEQISIIIILLFVSLAFIPCINGNSDVVIIESRNVKSNSKIEELFTKLLKLKSILNNYNNDDCRCNDNAPRRRFPIICLLLTPLWVIVAIITEIITPVMNPPFIYFELEEIGGKLGCWWG